MGTPHRGTRLATLSKCWWFRPSSDIRAILELNSRVLTDLDANFIGLSRVKNREVMIFSFHEHCPTRYAPFRLPFFRTHVSPPFKLIRAAGSS